MDVQEHCGGRGVGRGQDGFEEGIPLMWLVGGVFTVLEKNRDTVAGKPKILAHVAFTEGLLLSTVLDKQRSILSLGSL